MKSFTITTKNDKPSTIADIMCDANKIHTVIISNVCGGEKDVLRSGSFRTEAGALNFVRSYRERKLRAFLSGELADGIEIV